MNMRLLRPFGAAAVLGLVLIGCSKDTTEPVDLGFDYFPTQVGKWVEYQVDSTWYDEFNSISGTVSYRVRETVFEDFTDPEGRPAQRIRREVQDTAGVWHTHDIWWQVRTASAAEKTEENMRRLKLSFPAGPNRYWNANVYNTGEELELTFGDLHLPYSVNGMDFDSTLTVKSTYFNNIIDTISFNERYAKHVGLVRKRWVRSNSQWDVPLQQFLTRGWTLNMVAVAHGG